jgi:hypothetical protein
MTDKHTMPERIYAEWWPEAISYRLSNDRYGTEYVRADLVPRAPVTDEAKAQGDVGDYEDDLITGDLKKECLWFATNGWGVKKLIAENAANNVIGCINRHFRKQQRAALASKPQEGAKDTEELVQILARAECDLARFHGIDSARSGKWTKEQGRQNEWVAGTLNIIRKTLAKHRKNGG